MFGDHYPLRCVCVSSHYQPRPQGPPREKDPGDEVDELHKSHLSHSLFGLHLGMQSIKLLEINTNAT